MSIIQIMWRGCEKYEKPNLAYHRQNYIQKCIKHTDHRHYPGINIKNIFHASQ